MKLYLRQVVTQLSIYGIEVLLASKIISSLLNLDILVAYGLYQMVVFLILSNYDSIKKDELNAYLTFLNLAKHSIEYNSDSDSNVLESRIYESIQDEKQLLSPGIRNKFSQLILHLNDKEYIDKEIIMVEHNMRLIELAWRGSFLLRLLK